MKPPPKIAIPPGWTQEWYAQRYVHIVWPEHGAVTLDTLIRGFRGGFVYHGPLTSKEMYYGRGWAQRMTNDAVAWLMGVMMAAQEAN